MCFDAGVACDVNRLSSTTSFPPDGNVNPGSAAGRGSLVVDPWRVCEQALGSKSSELAANLKGPLKRPPESFGGRQFDREKQDAYGFPGQFPFITPTLTGGWNVVLT